MNKLSKEGFVSRSIELHGEKYNYSAVVYKNNRTNVLISCPTHGIFEQKPEVHLRGIGCSKCSNRARYSTIDFIEKAALVHGGKFSYELVEYKNAHTKVKITCLSHGIFEQKPYAHLQGNGCGRCSGTAKDTTSTFIKKAIIVHGDKFSYESVEYVSNKEPVLIKCYSHGQFQQTPNVHLKGAGCPKCAKNFSYDSAEFVRKALILHNNRYTYDVSMYINRESKVDVSCPIHGMFQQKADYHLSGNGCPKCSKSKGEIMIADYLTKREVWFVSEYSFADCKMVRPLKFDFYLPDKNICIEYDGEQHFEATTYFGGQKAFDYRLLCDSVKDKYCKGKGIKLVRIAYFEYDNIANIIEVNL